MTVSKNPKNIIGQMSSSSAILQSTSSRTARKPNNLDFFTLRSTLLASAECLKRVKSSKMKDFKKSKTKTSKTKISKAKTLKAKTSKAKTSKTKTPKYFSRQSFVFVFFSSWREIARLLYVKILRI